MYEIRYGTPDHFNRIHANTESEAVKKFNNTVSFAERNDLKWTVAMLANFADIGQPNRWWLERSAHINGTRESIFD